MSGSPGLRHDHFLFPGQGRQQVHLAAVGVLGTADGLAIYPDLYQRQGPGAAGGQMSAAVTLVARGLGQRVPSAMPRPRRPSPRHQPW